MTDLHVHITAKRYGHGPLVLKDLDIALADGEVTAVLGPSGVGKTTLLNMLAGLERDYEGEIHREGAPDNGRQRIGMVFQDPRLLPWMTVRDNIGLVLPDPASETEWIDELLAAVHLEDYADALPGQLSGGMQRRVALARAFVVRPELLLLDEPFVSLDAPTAKQLRSFLMRLWRTLHPTIVVVSHDTEDAVTLADRLYFLSSSPAHVIMEQSLPASEGAASERLRRQIMARLLASHPGLLAGALTLPPGSEDRSVQESGS